MDLDDDKLTEDEIKKLQEESNKKIEDAIKKINEACEELSGIDFIQHLMVVGYVDVGLARGFVSANYNLKEMESQTTFLLDYLSRNIKEAVRNQARQNVEKLKEVINKEEEKNKNDK